MGNRRSRRAGLVTATVAVAVIGAAWWPRQSQQRVHTNAARSTVSPEPAGSSKPAVEPSISVNHYPTTLVAPGQGRVLRFMVWCGLYDHGRGCDVTGTLYSRVGRSGDWVKSAIVDTGQDILGTGPWAAELPADQAAAELVEYYSEFTDAATGTVVVLPSTGADSPVVSRQLGDDTPSVELAEAERVEAPEPIASFGIGSGDHDFGLSDDAYPEGPSTIAVDGDTAWVVDVANDRLVSIGPDGKISGLELANLRQTVGGGAQGAAVAKGHLYMSGGNRRIWRVDLHQQRPTVEEVTFGRWDSVVDDVVADPAGDGVWFFSVERWIHLSATGDVLGDQPLRPSAVGPLAAIHLLGGGTAVGLPDGRAWILTDKASSLAPNPGYLQLLTPVRGGLIVAFSGSETAAQEGWYRFVALDPDGSASRPRLMTVPAGSGEVHHGLTTVAAGTESLFVLADTPRGTDIYRIPFTELTDGAK